MSKKKRTLIITITIGLLLSVMLFVFMTQLERELLRDYETNYVVRSIKDIPAGTWLWEDNVTEYFALDEVNGKVITNDTVCMLQSLYGTYVKRDVSAGEIIYRPVLCAQMELLENYVMPAELSIRIEDVADAVAGTLRKGDSVSVYVNAADTEIGQTSYRAVLQNIIVNEAYDSAGTVIGMSDTIAKTCIITVHVEAERVAEILTCLSSGNVVITKNAEKY